MTIIKTTADDVFEAPQAALTDRAPDINTSIWSIKGRLGVLKYNAFSLFVMLFFAIPLGTSYFLSGGSFEEMMNVETLSTPALIIFAVTAVVIIPILWIGIALFIRRLHDLNLSGWFALVALLPIVSTPFTLFVMCVPGKQEANKWGKTTELAKWEKIVGVIGLLLMVPLTIASVLV